MKKKKTNLHPDLCKSIVSMFFIIITAKRSNSECTFTADRTQMYIAVMIHGEIIRQYTVPKTHKKKLTEHAICKNIFAVKVLFYLI